MTEKPKRSPLSAHQWAKKFTALGLKSEPGWTIPNNRFHLSRRYQRDRDEGWFKKQAPKKTENEE